MIQKDLLWKAIIKDLFPYFLKYFFGKYEEEVDWTKGFEFLDKELEKLFPESKQKNRRADLLVKVFLKNGEERWILIHIEVQGYVDPEFPLRMFMYNYRSFDRLGKRITAIAVLTDDDEDYHPKYYEYKLWDTKLRYDFKTYKLLEKKLEDFDDDSNVFALVMKTAWYGLKNNVLSSDDDLLKLKVKLIRELLKHEIPKERIEKVLGFISHYVSFKREKYQYKLDQEIDILKEKHRSMTTTEVIKSELLRIGREEGMEKGMEKGIRQTASKTIVNLHLANHSTENIALWLKYPKEFVVAILKEYQQKELIKSMLSEGKSINKIKNELEVTDDLIQEVVKEQEKEN